MSVGWNIVPSTTTINIREAVLKLWHDGVRYKRRSQPGTKMIRIVCCGGSNPYRGGEDMVEMLAGM